MINIMIACIKFMLPVCGLNRSKGQSSVEVAIIVPTMLLTTLTCVDLSRMQMETAKLHAAAHEGSKIISQAGVYIADCIANNDLNATRSDMTNDLNNVIQQIEDTQATHQGNGQNNGTPLVVTGENPQVLLNRLNRLKNDSYSRLNTRQTLCSAIINRTLQVLSASGIASLNFDPSRGNQFQNLTTETHATNRGTEIKKCLVNENQKICFVTLSWTDPTEYVTGDDGLPVRDAFGSVYRMNVHWVTAGVEITLPYQTKLPSLIGAFENELTSRYMTLVYRSQTLPNALVDPNLVQVSQQTCNIGGLGFNLGTAKIDNSTYCP